MTEVIVIRFLRGRKSLTPAGSLRLSAPLRGFQASRVIANIFDYLA